MEWWLIVAVIACCVFGSGLAFAAYLGASQLWDNAVEQGFTGRTAYIAMWVFFSPVMLVICFAAGVIVVWNDRPLSKG